MPPELPLAQRVAVITGSTRGIGRALALRLAREGAAVVVTGKSLHTREKLPGSIHTVAAEIEEAGGTAMAHPLDVRQEESVTAMVDDVLEKFGRIDILINNAGALWWQPILETPPRRFDLMWQVNVRGAYLCTYAVLPAMRRQRWGHIINFSPPLDDKPHPGYVAYMITKAGMTQLAMGVAAEHANDGIAANTLWPVTLIESQATINHNVGDRSLWRSPDIICDAALEILKTTPPELSGKQLLDEPFLRERGWDDARMDSYWLAGKAPEQPIYIDGRPGSVM